MNQTNSTPSPSRYALVTGASSGIGRAIAEQLAAKGISLAITARREQRLRALADQLEQAHNIRVDIFPADLAKAGAAQALYDAVTAVQNIDILVNNAGMAIGPMMVKTELAKQEMFLDLTVRAPTTLTYLCLPHMQQQGWGRIMNVSSVMALSSGGKGNTLYPAGKAYLLKMSQSLNAEMRPYGIHVSAVLPGVVATDFQTSNGGQAVKDSIMTQTPEFVAMKAIAGNEKGHEIILPSWPTKIMAAFMRYCPEYIMRKLTRPMAKKYYSE